MCDMVEFAVINTEVRPLAPFLAVNETGSREHLEVMAHGGLAQSKWLCQVADAHLAVRRDEADQSQS